MASNREYKEFPLKVKIGDYTTPIGVGVYPHLVKADTKWKPEGEFRTKLKYDATVAEKIRADLTKALDTAFETYKELLLQFNKKGKALVKTVTKAALPLTAETDDEGDETGFFLLNTKRTASGKKKNGEVWKAKIVIADSKGVAVPTKNLQIWSGTEMRVMGEIKAWYNAKDNQIGISVEIAGVQIKKLVSGGDRDVNFDAIEDDDGDGWTADMMDSGAGTDSDADADSDETSDDTPDF